MSVCPQLLLCGTGDIDVQDFKAHAVVVGGSWHFREKVGDIARSDPQYTVKDTALLQH